MTKETKEDKAMNTVLNKMKNKSAQDILKEYGTGKKIPVDIVSIAENIGIKLHSVNFETLEETDAFKERTEQEDFILGAASTDEDSVTILYSNRFPTNKGYEHISEAVREENLKRRQRLTIAHEIGHCCLHMKEGDYHVEFRTDLRNNDKDNEKEANIFAGELLIPENMVRDIYSLCSRADVKPTIPLLATLFRVSKSAMTARIKHLKKSPESFLYEG